MTTFWSFLDRNQVLIFILWWESWNWSFEFFLKHYSCSRGMKCKNINFPGSKLLCRWILFTCNFLSRDQGVPKKSRMCLKIEKNSELLGSFLFVGTSTISVTLLFHFRFVSSFSWVMILYNVELLNNQRLCAIIYD